MSYAKLIDGAIVYSPRKLPVGDFVVYNPTPEMLTDAGYKPVVYTEPPETEPGFEAVPGWYDDGTEIREVWTVIVAPVSEEDALVRYSNELTGAHDETLEEATETLIKLKMEE